VNMEEVGVDLSPGDLLVLYSDGITDANSPAGEFFGVERLQEAICGTGSLTAQDVCDLIFESVDQFQARAEQYDDMALLVMRANGETWSP